MVVRFVESSMNREVITTLKINLLILLITTSWLGTRLLNTLPCRVQSALNSCFSNFNISFAGKRTCCIS
ncbi:hypothetical protein V6N11_058390 [Hibiscus sabdariffa]|uniref:Uncharacterized protein n=1 Tax=Hibiscus sabdariffa TaxID=183260 RepID=A0ABR2U431_9ROSI